MTKAATIRPARLTARLRLFAAAMAAMLALPAVGLCQYQRLPPLPAASEPRDQWGLTARDWLMKSGPELRAAVGFPAAFPRVLAAGQQGDVKAAALLAGAYAVGAGVQPNDAESFRWAQIASGKGLPFGDFVLALKYRDGGAAPRDPKKAFDLSFKAARAGYRPGVAEWAMMPPVKELRNGFPTENEAEALLAQAAADGEPRAAEIVGILRLNMRLADALSGKPVWKDNRGPFGHGHVEFVQPLGPCSLLIKDDAGPIYTVTWGRLNIWRPQSTSLVFEGETVKANTLFYSLGESVPVTDVLGFVLLENNNKYTPEQTREVFRGMEADARGLNRMCAKYRR